MPRFRPHLADKVVYNTASGDCAGLSLNSVFTGLSQTTATTTCDHAETTAFGRQKSAFALSNFQTQATKFLRLPLFLGAPYCGQCHTHFTCTLPCPQRDALLHRSPCPLFSPIDFTV